MAGKNAKTLIEQAMADERDVSAQLPALRRLAGKTMVIGVAVAALSLFWHLQRFWSAYMLAFSFVLSITLGGLFFVLIQHLVRAGWSVVVRRVAEAVAMNMVLCAVLFIPLLIGIGLGYLQPRSAWTVEEHHAEAAADQPAAGGNAVKGNWKDGPDMSVFDVVHAPMDESKKAWLSYPCVVLRWVLYFAFWIATAWYYWKTSVKQDETKDPALTIRLQKLAAPATLLYAITTTLAGFDLLMALDPHWSSTIFGVYFWAGGFVSFCAALILILYLCQRRGLISKAVTAEHYHDVGKFMFAWIVFWAYIAYSQYMLIWYGTLPEEQVFYVIRQAGAWAWFSLLCMVFGHFVIPFLLLLSRFPKRRPGMVALGAVYVLGIHFIDLFWLIQPQKSPLGVVPVPILDVALAAALVGAYAISTGHFLSRASLVAVGDPRLGISLAHENY